MLSIFVRLIFILSPSFSQSNFCFSLHRHIIRNFYYCQEFFRKFCCCFRNDMICLTHEVILWV
nr:MAG TPA: hypothetical protein [Bacteriophage sp.]